MATIKYKPKLAVAGLGAPTRSGYTMSASWEVPADLTKTKNKSRATGLRVEWTLGASTGGVSAAIIMDASATSSAISYDYFVAGAVYRRSSFYPLSSRKLRYVTCSVTPYNKKGSGPTAIQTRYFGAPRAPSISAPSFNAENGVVSATISTDAGADYNERYDTRYIVTIKNTRTGRTWTHANSSSTSTSFTLSYNASDYQQLAYGQYIQVTFQAWARGLVGDSGKVSRTIYVGYPAQASIQGIYISSKDSSGKCTVKLKTNSSTTQPVDRVKLSYLANVTYKNAKDIPGNASWTDTNITDDAACTALAMPVLQLIPDRGKVTWVRVKSWHLSEDVLCRYSTYKRITALETPAPTAEDDDIDILSVTAGANGDSAIVVLGWNADGRDDSTGTELTWSDEEDTWKSTKDPDEYRFSWSDGAVVVGQTTYRDSATITIKDLAQSTKYYIRARRYLDGDEGTTYSKYSNTATVLTSETPESIVASCDRFVAKGEPLTVRWTFAGKGLQTAWQIVDSNLTTSYRQVIGPTGNPSGQGFYELVNDEYVLSADTQEDNSKTYYEKETYGAIIANGEGSAGSTQISAERLASFAHNGFVKFTVQASTGSAFVVSEEHSVQIIEQPTLVLTTTNTLTAQPFSFVAETNALCDLIVIVTSQGAMGQFPQGMLMQASGDTIHSDVYSPMWTVSNDVYSATITLPSGLDFWNLGHYTLSVVAIDRNTGLRSNEVTASFGVDWANNAVDPEDGITLTVIDTVDEDGDHRQAVQIDLVPPTGSSQTDVYDIYRMDIENPHLIGEGFPLTHTTVDEYAPFGNETELHYRIALRTVDGDVAFTDMEYTAQCEHMRFDWEGGMLELPYGLSIADSFSKDSEIRQHMDGSSDGYWNQNIERKSALNSSIVKILQPEDIERTRQLARYAGPVFVRLPNGSAFEADVQVTDLSVTNKAVNAVAFDAVEIGLTSEFVLPTPFSIDEEES